MLWLVNSYGIRFDFVLRIFMCPSMPMGGTTSSASHSNVHDSCRWRIVIQMESGKQVFFKQAHLYVDVYVVMGVHWCAECV